MLTPDQRSTLAPPSPYVQASDPDTPQEWASWDQRMFAMYRYFQRVKKLIDEHKEGLKDDEEDTLTPSFSYSENSFYSELCEMILVSAMFLEGKNENPDVWRDTIYGKDYTSEFVLKAKYRGNRHFTTAVCALMNRSVDAWFNICLDEFPKESSLCFDRQKDSAVAHKPSVIHEHVRAFQRLQKRLQRYMRDACNITTNEEDSALFARTHFLIEYVVGTQEIPDEYMKMVDSEELHLHPLQWLKETFIFCGNVLGHLQSKCSAVKNSQRSMRAKLSKNNRLHLDMYTNRRQIADVFTVNMRDGMDETKEQPVPWTYCYSHPHKDITIDIHDDGQWFAYRPNKVQVASGFNSFDNNHCWASLDAYLHPPPVRPDIFGPLNSTPGMSTHMASPPTLADVFNVDETVPAYWREIIVQQCGHSHKDIRVRYLRLRQQLVFHSTKTGQSLVFDDHAGGDSVHRRKFHETTIQETYSLDMFLHERPRAPSVAPRHNVQATD